MAVDLLGHGKSEVSEKWDDYTTKSLVADVIAIIDLFPSSSTIVVAHSYGCILSTFLYPELVNRIQAMIFIAPLAHLQEHRVKIRWLTSLPNFVIDVIRRIDRWGGINSPSVNRFVGKNADAAVRYRQLAWNKDSKTAVFRRMIHGMTFPSITDFEKISCPLLLIGGAEDNVAPPVPNLAVIHETVRPPSDAPNPAPFVIPAVGHQTMLEQPAHTNAIIGKFLVDRFEALDPEWQILQTKENNPLEKWSLKNFEKWQRTDPVSPIPIGPTPLRAMKIMRQLDAVHSPYAFLAAHPEVGTVIDISKDEPPYQTYDLSEKNVEYIKIAAKSKSPPTRQEVKRFIEAVKTAIKRKPDKQVAVHCHYGYNRTGFMICSYMIEACRVPIPAAIRNFAEARPKGIRHVHFKDELYLRYARQVRITSMEPQ